MTTPLIMKLECGATLSGEERAALLALTRTGHQVDADQDLVRQGDRPEFVHLVVDGLAYRYKSLSGGRRQIIAFLVPGDFCDLHVAILAHMDHSIATLTPCSIARISRQAILDLSYERPGIAHALWWATLVDEAILREWLLNIGQRPAAQQLAHLYCELLVRLQLVGRATADSFAWPVTQTELAETLGMSAVHVNRMLQELRGEGLVVYRDGTLTIPDVERLKAYAEFDPGYLHLLRRRPLANQAAQSDPGSIT